MTSNHTTPHVHFIAIGGAAMHNLAIVLHQKGYLVTGSDDEIYEPSKTRLADNHLLPSEIGWFPEKIHANLNAVILGMHARKDNPELLRVCGFSRILNMFLNKAKVNSALLWQVVMVKPQQLR